MKRIFVLLLLCTQAWGQSAPSGWTSSAQGNVLQMKPADLPVSRTFVYSLFPESQSTGSLTSWLRQTALADRSGERIGEMQTQGMGDIETLTTGIKKDGKSYLMIYLGAKTDEQKQLGTILTDMDAKVSKPYLEAAVKHFIRTTGVKVKKTVAEKSKDRPKRPETPVTAPGKGLTDAQIVGVYMHLETGFGVGGFVTQDYNAYLVLKDGTIYDNLSVSPYDLDVPASRQVEPKRWGTWKRQGKQLLVTEANGKTSTWDEWHEGKPARTNETIRGSFKSISGGGNVAFGGTTTVASVKNITLSEAGQFSLASSGSGNSAGVSVYSNKDQAGRYRLDRYSITMEFNNGTVERRFFYFYPDSRKTFQIGGSVFVTNR